MLKEPQLGDDAPWKRRFRIPIYFAPSLASAAPGRGMVISNEAGSFQLYAWNTDNNALRQLTQRPEGLRDGHLSPDGRWAYYLEDKDGDEIGHYVRIPFEGGGAQDLTPSLPPYSSWSFDESANGSRIGFMVADDDGHHLYVMDRGAGRSVGAPQLVYESRMLIAGPYLSADSSLALVLTTERSSKGQFSLIAVDLSDGHRIAELWDGADTSVETAPHAFSPVPGDSRVLASSNRSGFMRPLVWDIATRERRDLEIGGLEGEVFPMDWSPDGKRIILVQVHAARQTIHLYDLDADRLLPVKHPGGTWSSVQFGPGGQIYAGWQDATHPRQVVKLDPETGEVQTLLASRDVPPARPWESVTFPGANGEPIQAWLIRPEGEGPFPVILDTHGGPQMATFETFNPRFQMWPDHGFALLSVNFHGSTTFGKEFQESILGRVGELEVEDMVAARKWLVDNGIADPERILLTGWSYGGYLTLHALGLHPDLWAGGMAGVPVADWPACHEDSAETLKGSDAGLFGGRLEEMPEAYRKASPLTYVENVTKPVLIIQGRNDTRCPRRQVEMYEARMKELGKPIEVVWFDSGHGSLLVEQNIKDAETMLEFAYRVLALTP